MIVVCRFYQYGVAGKKINELADYLKKNVCNTYVEDISGFVQMKRSIRKKVKELNDKYPETVPVEFFGNIDERYGDGGLIFKRPHASDAVINMSVYVVKEFKEGGEQ